MKGITFLLHRVYKAADAVKSPTEVQQQREQEKTPRNCCFYKYWKYVLCSADSWKCHKQL